MSNLYLVTNCQTGEYYAVMATDEDLAVLLGSRHHTDTSNDIDDYECQKIDGEVMHLDLSLKASGM